MWIDSNFMNTLGSAMKDLSNGNYVDTNEIFKDYDSRKYRDIITGIHNTAEKMKSDREDIEILLKDSNMMNQAAVDGKLDKRIDNARYNNKDFQTITNGLNDTVNTTVTNLRVIGDNLDKLSNGDFQANVSQDMKGDYTVLKNATNNLGIYLNFLIDDSNEMSQATKVGELDVRIDSSKYQGDFQKIVHGVNETMETTILVLRDIGSNLDKLSNGDLTAKIEKEYEGDYQVLQFATNNLSSQLNINRDENNKQSWIRNGIAELNEALAGENTIVSTSSKAITYIGNYLNAGVGAIYTYNKEDEILTQSASYAFVQREELSNKFALGEGTVGQVALQKSPIQLKNIKRTSSIITTGTTSEAPINTYTFPLIYQDELYGVVEIGSHLLFDEKAAEFFELANNVIATSIATAVQNEKVKLLLEKTQQNNFEIQEANAQMAEQQQQLEEANVQMEEQQQQLEEANAEMTERQQQLEEANTQMEEQQQQLREQNEDLEQSRKEIDQRAAELELSNQYKSEFLANMSHELRTPLNSIILLSESMKENKQKHLNEKDIKRAGIIHRSGEELLRLINDILDLSKVEAGKMDLIVNNFTAEEFLSDLHVQFEESAQAKGLELKIQDNYKGNISNDRDRLGQVVRNFVSNALKFTNKGSITIGIDKEGNGDARVYVTDTGIGIPKDKLKLVFEAFQQIDGTISREYGGTGLGLSISRELGKLMKGHLELESELSQGSTFIIIIPNLIREEGTTLEELIRKQESRPKALKKEIEKTVSTAAEVGTVNQAIKDDRENIKKGEKAYLVVEDNLELAEAVSDKIREQGEKVIVAETGGEAIYLASQYALKGVMLDLGLPDIDGIDVLKTFKTNLALKTIPIYIISADDKEKLARIEGAIGYTQKPLRENSFKNILNSFDAFNKKEVKDLLIVEDNKVQREALIDFIGTDSVKTRGVESVSAAITELAKGIYDAVIVDLTLKSGSGFEVCEYIKKNEIKTPIIIYTGKELTEEEEIHLKKYTDSIIIKSAASQNRLMANLDLFLHRVKKNMPVERKKINEIDFKSKKILLVDDDIRNIYVLADLLEDTGAEVITARNGQKALDALEEHADINIVLMDIMMPVLNGYEATASMRKNEKFRNIPVIALTAKAMPEDKKEALDAGCDDYVTKPIKSEILLGVMSGWLSK